MVIRLLLIFSYIAYCCRLRVKPWLYFQLNAQYFNEEKGIFSKLEIDRLIPYKWRLKQERDDLQSVPKSFPVFVKPEWGQNAHGIALARDINELNRIRRDRTGDKRAVLLQEAAPESTEFEVFFTKHPSRENAFGLVSVTQVENLRDGSYPINSINNEGTVYHNISEQLSDKDKQGLWQLFSEIGQFNIARFGLRANSLSELLEGHFHIIEINLFLPMPIHLLCSSTPWRVKQSFIFDCTKNLALLTQQIPNSQRSKNVFFRKMKVHKRVKAQARI